MSLLNPLQFTRDLAQHTRPVVPVLCDENIHYRICKMMYGEKTTGWNVRLFLRSNPILYGFWHAYKSCVTQTFLLFSPTVTFFRKCRLRYAVGKAMHVLLTQYCPMLLHLGHLVRQCNRAGDNANTGVLASEGLQILMCPLDRLNMGDTLLEYNRTVANALLCHTAWHSAMPGQSFAEKFCENQLSSLVTRKGGNRGAVTIDDVENLYLT